jgi:hypothetical protein
MVGIPRLALVAVAGALPFAGALLAKDAPGEPPRPAGLVIDGDRVPEQELQRRAGRYVGADARALATRDAVRVRIERAAEHIDPAALEQAKRDTQAFDNVFSRVTEITRSRTTCAGGWHHDDVCGDYPAATWWMGATDIRRFRDRWTVTGKDVDWAKTKRKLRRIAPFVADRVDISNHGARARTREHAVTVARAAFLVTQRQRQR